jgi:hypothetical protein
VKGCLRAAKKFREYWLLAKDSEVAGCQKYWISLLGDASIGVEDADGDVLDRGNMISRIEGKEEDAQIAPTARAILDSLSPDSSLADLLSRYQQLTSK